MAEGIFNALARERGVQARAQSCGIYASEGTQASSGALRAAAEYGADISAHRARQAAKELMRSAGRIYCMSGAHLDWIKSHAPDCAGKAALLDPEGISDPFGGIDEDYERTAERIYDRICVVLDETEWGDV